MNRTHAAALPLAAMITASLVAVPSPGMDRKDAATDPHTKAPPGKMERPQPTKALPVKSINPARSSASPTALRHVGMTSNPDEGGIANSGNVAWGERFETGFVAGSGCGQNDWSGFCGGPGIGFEIIQNAPATGRLQEYSGRHTSDGSNFLGFEMNSPQYIAGSGRVEADVIISEGGLHYQLVTIDNGTLFFNTRVQFEADGTITSLTTTDCFAGTFTPTTGTWTPGVLMRIGVEVLSGGVLNLYKDGALIYTGLDIAQQCAGGSPNVDAIWTFAYNSSATATYTLDNIGSPVQLNCLSDITGPFGFRDGATGIDDLLAVVGAWGPCSGKCPTDISGPAAAPDGQTGIDDLLAVVGAWGACPDPIGACCTAGACSQSTFADCVAGGGVYVGDNIACVTGTCAANDECSVATPVTLGANASTFVGGTTGTDPTPSCSFALGVAGFDVWHSYTNATANPQLIRVDTCSSSAPITDTLLAAYASCADAASGIELACNDDACGGSGLLSSMIMTVGAGQTVYIRAGIWAESTNTGPFVLNLEEVFPPANDACANAISITGSINGAPVAGDNTVATPALGGGDDLELPGGSPSCHWNFNPDATHSTVWYSFVAPANGCVTVDFCSNAGSMVDSILALYSGSCGTLTEVTCEEDTVGCLNFYSRMRAFGLTPGATYLLMVGNPGDWAGSIPGSYTFTITDECPPPPPANDSCASPIDITGNINGADVTGDNTAATPAVGGFDTELPGGSPSCQWAGVPSTTHSTVWYSFVAPASGCVTVTTCASAGIQDTILALYSGTCGALVEVACGEDDPGCINFYSTLEAAGLTPGATYLLMLGNPGSWAGSVAGAYTMSITDGCPPPPPANDECLGAGLVAPLVLGVNAVDTSAASTSPDFASCAALGTDLWFNYVATAATATFSTCGSTALDTAIEVFDGCGGSVLGCNDDACGLQTSVSVAGLTLGATYKIRVGHFAGGPGGPFIVTITP